MIDVWATLGLILVGFFLVWLSKQVDLGFGDVSKAAIILVPLFIYLLVTGKIAEFEGLGLKAKFREVASRTVAETARAADLMISIPQANKPKFFRDAFTGQCRPYYVINGKTALRPDEKLDTEMVRIIAASIRYSILCGKFSALIVVDDDAKPLGFFPSSQFLEILRIPLVIHGTATPDLAALYEALESSELADVLGSAVRRADKEGLHTSVPKNEPLKVAYDRMNKDETNLAMIVDERGQFIGIITRSAIQRRMLNKMFELGG